MQLEIKIDILNKENKRNMNIMGEITEVKKKVGTKDSQIEFLQEKLLICNPILRNQN